MWEIVSKNFVNWKETFYEFSTTWNILAAEHNSKYRLWLQNTLEFDTLNALQTKTQCSLLDLNSSSLQAIPDGRIHLNTVLGDCQQ